MNGNLSVRYAICNDVFRYLAEPADVPAEDETAPIEAATPTVVPTEDAPEAPSDATVDAPPPAAPAAVVEEATPTEEVSTGASDDGAAAGSEATPASVVEPVVAGGGDEGVPEVAPVAAVAAPAPSAPVAPVGDTAAPVPKVGGLWKKCPCIASMCSWFCVCNVRYSMGRHQEVQLEKAVIRTTVTRCVRAVAL